MNAVLLALFDILLHSAIDPTGRGMITPIKGHPGCLIQMHLCADGGMHIHYREGVVV